MTWPNGAAPSLDSWQRPGLGNSSECWSTSIPLRAGGRALGEIEIRRGLAKDRLLFQFSSLLDTLIPSFEKQLSLRYEVAGLSRSETMDVRRNAPLASQARAATGSK